MSKEHNLQVSKEHYYSDRYFHKARWITYFHQIKLLEKYNCKRVLEVGHGHGWMRTVAKDLGFHIETLDIDPELEPTHVGSINEIPLNDNSFDCVCAFEVLEHMPYDEVGKNLSEMARVSKNKVMISVPDHRHILFHLRLKLPLIKYKEVFIKIMTNKKHEFDGQHYWELGKKGFSPSRLITIAKEEGLDLVESNVYPDTPANHYFVFSTNTQ